jgi:hypothetical protein
MVKRIFKHTNVLAFVAGFFTRCYDARSKLRAYLFSTQSLEVCRGKRYKVQWRP